MRPGIIGTGWITPAGRDITSTCESALSGHIPSPVTLDEAPSWPVLKVSADSIKDATAQPRLRRSSVISHLAVAAATDAVAASGLSAEQLARTALVFTTSDGGVAYTRRFHGDVISRGPGAGSPLLFPETVYNAPASHVAAILGLAGELLTMVGDAASGLSSLHTAIELMMSDEVEHCLVVAAQEVDWISAQAYGRWGLIHGARSDAAYFAEGAAAIVLAKNEGTSLITYSNPGINYSTNREAGQKLTRMLNQVAELAQPEIIVSSHAGNHFDHIEDEACQAVFPQVNRIEPKKTLGDSLAASALEQVILADWLLKKGKDSALVCAAGYNGQLSALLLTRAPG